MQQIQSFKREQGLEEGDVETTNGAEFEEEIDLRAEDDALIAAELDAAEAAKADEPDEDESDDAEDSDEDAKPRRRRGRRGGRRRHPRWQHRCARGHVRPRRGGLRTVARPRRRRQPRLRRALGRHRPVEVTIEEDKIVIRRAGTGDSGDDE